VSTGTPLLELDGLRAGYGGVAVVHDLDLSVSAGEVVALLGPNGAGKSTTLLTVSGLLPPLSGKIRYAGRTVSQGRRASSAAAAALARDGLAHVPEDRGLFFDLTVAEHLRLGRQRRRATATDVDTIIGRFPALRDLLSRKAGLLSGGEQQMLALAMTLIGRPRLLLIDEMSHGLAPIVVEQLLPALRATADDHGTGILLVEQHVALALTVADRAVVLQRGRAVISGAGREVSERLAEVEAGYFGDEHWVDDEIDRSAG
jgi:branched-chain amino acid transport system ATP-binding protein